LAKTLACRALATAVGGSFKRVQFTPDLLAQRHRGHAHLRSAQRRVHDRARSVFANVVLADEINRAPAKVQSALLEGMQERQVTIGPQTFRVARTVRRDSPR
jgi:MoxR-like ATPase